MKQLLRRPSRYLGLLLLPALLLLIGPLPTGQRPFSPVNAAGSLQSPNLLQNPGFEGSFFAWSGINEIQVAHGWTPFWYEDPDRTPAYHRPEYKRAEAATFGNRVLSGESAQQWFTFHASHWAGMHQQVFNVTPGQNYRFSIFAQVWSSTEDNPFVSVLPANPRLRVGIDPTGNWHAGAGTVIWSGEGPMSSHVDRWGEISVEAVAQNNVITVFMRTNPDYANKHNDMYWDNASLVALGPAQPTPPPPTETAAVTQPPPAPLPTATPLPPPPATATASPTIAPSATATATAVPPTATATATATTTATATAAPTETPLPSDTPLPTVTATLVPATEVAAVSPTPLPAAPTAEPSATNRPDLLLPAIAFLSLLVLLGLVALIWAWRRTVV
jgi:hypothetical protein